MSSCILSLLGWLDWLIVYQSALQRDPLPNIINLGSSVRSVTWRLLKEIRYFKWRHGKGRNVIVGGCRGFTVCEMLQKVAACSVLPLPLSVCPCPLRWKCWWLWRMGQPNGRTLHHGNHTVQWMEQKGRLLNDKPGFWFERKQSFKYLISFTLAMAIIFLGPWMPKIIYNFKLVHGRQPTEVELAEYQSHPLRVS